MLNERKLTERELDKRSEAIKGLLSNKRALVQKYGKDAEKVMYGIATKQAKKKIEDMNLDNLKELIKKSLQQEMESTPTVPNASTDLTKNIDTGFSGPTENGGVVLNFLWREDNGYSHKESNDQPHYGQQKFLLRWDNSEGINDYIFTIMGTNLNQETKGYVKGYKIYIKHA